MTRLFSFLFFYFISVGILFSQLNQNNKQSIKSINNHSIQEKFKSDFLRSTGKQKEKTIGEIEQLDSITFYSYDSITFDLRTGEKYLVDFQNKVAIDYVWDSIKNEWKINFKDVIVYNNNDSSYLQTYTYLPVIQQYVFSKREYRKLSGGINYVESYAANLIGQWKGIEKSETKEDSTGFLLLNANYEWDSIAKVWVGNNKSEFLYDSLGHTIFEQLYSWDNINKTWIYSSKNEYTFDKFNNLNLKASYLWNSLNNEWDGIQKYEYEFDVNFNELSYLIFDWNSTSKNWDSLRRTESVFDQNNKLTETIKSNWDSNLNTFIVYQRINLIYNLDLDLIYEYQTDISTSKVYSKKEITYLTQSKINQLIYSTSLDSVNWKFDKKDTIEYDVNQNPLLQKSLNWNTVNNIWESIPKINDIRIDYGVNQNGTQLIATSVFNGVSFDSISKKIYFYDNLSHLISEENYVKNGNSWIGISNGKTDYYYNNGLRYTYATYNWDLNSLIWIGNWKSIHRIDKALNGISSEYIEDYVWDNVKNEWVGSEKTQYSYDSKDKPTLIYNFIWNSLTKNWNNSQKIEYTNPLNFDDYIQYVWSSSQYVWVKSLKSEYFENDSIHKTTLSHWQTLTVNWREFSLYTNYFYQPKNSASLNEEVIDNITTLFPNPSNGNFTIKNAQKGIYTIVNSIGKEVSSFEIADSLSTNIYIGTLQSGYYLITPKNRTKNQQSISIIIE